MAAGDIKWFAQGLLDMGKKLHDLSADTIKLGIITNAATPALSTADPRWGAGGTTNFSTNQVATGGSSYTGPLTLASVTWTLVANVPTFRATDPVLVQDAAGFTNGFWGIIYNDTDAGKRCLCFVEFNTARSLVAGGLTINFGGAGTDIVKITAT